MRQFLLPREYAGEARISLAGDDLHYLTRVLRLREGDAFPAIDAGGTRYTLRLLSIGAEVCEAAVEPAPAGEPLPLRETSSLREPDLRITLLQCLPKGPKMDSIVRQATEAGVTRIVPLHSEHSLLGSGDLSGRQRRWERIAREALQQSGNPRLPVLEQPRPLMSIRAAEEWGTALFFHEKPLGNEPLHELLAHAPSQVSVLIGPEGGLSPAEVDFLEQAGFRPVYLGQGVLRVDTAAIAAVAVVKQIVRETHAWRPISGK
jgi:16S rRNA (uracil1498-N3)-methyltransferase